MASLAATLAGSGVGGETERRVDASGDANGDINVAATSDANRDDVVTNTNGDARVSDTNDVANSNGNGDVNGDFNGDVNLDVNGDASDTQVLTCPGHAGQTLDLYCVDCETAICRDCTRAEHDTHCHLVLDDAIADHKRLLRGLVSQVEGRLPQIDATTTTLLDASVALDVARESTETSVATTFDSLASQLASRRAVVLAEVNSVHDRMKRHLQARLEALASLRTNIEACCEFTNCSLQHGGATELLLLRKQMARQLRDLAAEDVVNGDDDDGGKMTFKETGLTALGRCIADVGSVDTGVIADATANGDGLTRCLVGTPSTISVTCLDRHGDVLNLDPESVSAQLTSTDGNTNVNVSARVTGDVNESGLSVTYTALTAGMHHLYIRRDGQPIRGSPFRIKARCPHTPHAKHRSSSHSSRRSNANDDDLVRRVGVKGRGRGDFANPQGVAAGLAGDIIIADSNNVCIQEFSGVGEVGMSLAMRMCV